MARRNRKKKLGRTRVLAGDLVLHSEHFGIGVPGKGLLCPWCGQIAYRHAEGQELVELVMTHREKECPAAGEGSPMLPIEQLHRMSRLFALGDTFKSDTAYRVFARDGRWICPHCTEAQEISAVGPDGARLPLEELVRAIAAHVGQCAKFAEDPATHHSAEQLREVMQRRAEERSFREQVKQLMQTNPIMQFRDDEHRWVCPFCRNAIEQVDMATEKLREVAHERAAWHLRYECPVAEETSRLKVSVEEMQTVVEWINEQKRLRIMANQAELLKAPSQTVQLEALHAEVARLREQLGRRGEATESLERARAAQQHMLPGRLPTVPGYQLGHVFRSCEAVSGDFYDALEVPGGRVAILIGDVSGHGFAAALVMGMVWKAMHLRAKEGLSAAATLRKVNRDIIGDLQRGTFVAGAFAILDTAAHAVTYGRAGGCPAIVWRAAASEATLVNPPGMMLGVDVGPRFDGELGQHTIPLEVGDLFFQYTDGVTEAMSPAGEEFGVARLVEAVRSSARMPVEELLASVAAAVEKFRQTEPQGDDMTMVAVKRAE